MGSLHIHPGIVFLFYSVIIMNTTVFCKFCTEYLINLQIKNSFSTLNLSIIKKIVFERSPNPFGYGRYS